MASSTGSPEAKSFDLSLYSAHATTKKSSVLPGSFHFKSDSHVKTAFMWRSASLCSQFRTARPLRRSSRPVPLLFSPSQRFQHIELKSSRSLCSSLSFSHSLLSSRSKGLSSSAKISSTVSSSFILHSRKKNLDVNRSSGTSV